MFSNLFFCPYSPAYSTWLESLRTLRVALDLADIQE